VSAVAFGEGGLAQDSEMTAKIRPEILMKLPSY
jgi:hypothetical protein